MFLTSNNFSNIRHQNIHGLRVSSIIFALLHVESFDFMREPVQHDWFIDGVCHESLRGLGNILAKFIECSIFLLVVVILQPLNSLAVFHSSERFLWRNKFWVEFIDHVTERRLEHPVHHVTHQVLQSVQQLGEVNEWTLCLDMSVLSNMTPGDKETYCGIFIFVQELPGARFLSSVRLSNTEDVSHGRDAGLQVELAGLGEVGVLSEIFQMKQS